MQASAGVAAREDGVRRLSSLTTALVVTAATGAGVLTVAAALGTSADAAAAQQQSLARSSTALPQGSGSVAQDPNLTVPQQSVPQQSVPQQQPVWTPPQYTVQPPVGRSSGS